MRALADYLVANELSADRTSAWNFAREESAKALARGLRQNFQKRVPSRHAFTANEVAGLLCVGRTTIANWVGDGLLTPSIVPTRLSAGQGTRDLQFFTGTQIHEIIEWRFPNTAG